tara:strand:+ start:620 stop:982 length:363 start_codon:yes stop_codon:yes gene_type:complete
MVFSIKFLIDLFNESNFDNFINIGKLIILILLIYISVYFLNIFIELIREKIISILPSSIKRILLILSQIINYKLPFIIGAIIYHYWFEDKPLAIALTLIVLSSKITYLTKSKKENESQPQ